MTPFPVPHATASWWRTQLHRLDDYVSSDRVPEESDVVVIGAGIAGASVAYHLHQQNKGQKRLRVTILEARQTCSGATGRNGGHLKPDPYSSIGHIAAEHGMEAAAEVAEFERAHVDAITELVRTEKIDCDFVLTKAIDVQLLPEECRTAKANFDSLAAAGVKSVGRVAFYGRDDAEERCRVKGAQGCFTYKAGHIWPYKLVLHLLSHCVDQGANLYTNTPAQSVSSERDDYGRWTVTTPRGSIRTHHVVYASNAYTPAILPIYSGKIVPVRGVCCRIVPTRPVTRLTETYTLRWAEGEFDYLIPREDGSIIVGGAWNKYHQDKSNWYNVINDDEMIEPAREYFDQYMQRNFHGWEQSGAYVDQIWTGIMGYSADSLPHIGQVPGRPGQFIIAGFTGHGMPQAYLSGKGVAAMVSEGIPFAESGIPRLFETTQARIEHTRNDILESVQDLKQPRAKL
ncbi:hypothetical protein V499_02543 [Pseudogymnoascus sp. VKM F-103]|uniref:FAD dependent oxidoreductase domain-containing protein n=1 Tax=Pseudogymnoascus verrucosus TaxID=342668 RepID=A0A1B8GXG4_9PEZI|nr:uncharacterized protein VE01_01043 [Pseudogymnoascus verrucosus]KFY78227.1 hypothetical protein V499_02543 [Pseudogymnoascus sp. VKM F-103]OBU00524.1 hypothetical protein VE01_01043 [Pseudogymnoascus verrucosus]